MGSAISVSEQTWAGSSPVYAGFFLYMGGTDLLPGAPLQHASWQRVALTVAGFAAVYAGTAIAGV